MRLVNDDGVVRIQQRVGLRFSQQNTIGHQLDGRIPAQAVLKAHFEANHVTEWCFQLFSNALGYAGRSNAARLGVANQFGALACRVIELAAPHGQQNFRQLGRFAGAGFAANNHHLMGCNGGGDFFALARYRQRFGEIDVQN